MASWLRAGAASAWWRPLGAPGAFLAQSRGNHSGFTRGSRFGQGEPPACNKASCHRPRCRHRPGPAAHRRTRPAATRAPPAAGSSPEHLAAAGRRRAAAAPAAPLGGPSVPPGGRAPNPAGRQRAGWGLRWQARSRERVSAQPCPPPHRLVPAAPTQACCAGKLTCAGLQQHGRQPIHAPLCRQVQRRQPRRVRQSQVLPQAARRRCAGCRSPCRAMMLLLLQRCQVLQQQLRNIGMPKLSRIHQGRLPRRRPLPGAGAHGQQQAQGAAVVARRGAVQGRHAAAVGGSRGVCAQAQQQLHTGRLAIPWRHVGVGQARCWAGQGSSRCRLPSLGSQQARASGPQPTHLLRTAVGFGAYGPAH